MLTVGFWKLVIFTQFRLTMFLSFYGEMETFRRRATELRATLRDGPMVKSPSPTDEVRYTPLSDLEYPKLNKAKLKRIEKLWNDYYECLEDQYSAIGSKRFMYPIAVAVYIGGNFKLDCLYCISPAQASDSVRWYHREYLHGPTIEVFESEHKIIAEDDSLRVFNVQAEDAGIYYCVSSVTNPQAYYVHVFGDNEPIVEVKANETTRPHPAKTGQISLWLTSTWTKWTSCSHCGKAGRRKKFGACTVTAPTEPESIETLADNTTTVSNVSALTFFHYGLPCRSPLLPAWVRNMKRVKHKPNEVVKGYCKVKCTDTIFEVLNENGKLIGSANNSDGEFSALQAPARLPPVLGRMTLFIEVGSPAIIPCSGSSNIDAPVEWYINKSIKIFPAYLKNESNGRVTIDPRDRLVFARIERSDANIFTCWQAGDLAGIIRLIPIEAYFIEVDQHVLLIGVLIISILFSYLSFRIYYTKKLAMESKYQNKVSIVFGSEPITFGRSKTYTIKHKI